MKKLKNLPAQFNLKYNDFFYAEHFIMRVITKIFII